MNDFVKRYSRKPKHVEAVQLTEENIHYVAIWCGGKVEDRSESSEDTPIFELTVPNVEGNDITGVGSFVTHDLSNGRFYVKGANFFLDEYELPGEVSGVDWNDAGELPPKPRPAYLVGSVKNVPESFDPRTEPLTPHYVQRGRYDRA